VIGLNIDFRSLELRIAKSMMSRVKDLARSIGWTVVETETWVTEQSFDDWMQREERRLRGEPEPEERWVKASKLVWP